MLTTVSLPGCGDHEWISGNSSSLRQPRGPSAETVVAFFNAYFRKKPAPIPWDLLGLDGFTPLERLVWYKTAEIPFGRLAAYSDIAKAIGRPGAARFAGGALGKNPFPVIIPCHRVIRKDGGWGGFGSGLDMKRALVQFENSRRQPFLA